MSSKEPEKVPGIPGSPGGPGGPGDPTSLLLPAWNKSNKIILSSVDGLLPYDSQKHLLM